MFESRHHSPAGLPIATSFLFSLMSQMLWWASPAEAQGFFQQLLGLSSPPQVQSAPRASSSRQPIGGTPMRIQIPAESDGSGRSYRPASGATSGGKEGTGSYTTMCVRMCDGYYFPISHRVPRGRFYRDADVCRTRCDQGDARLFYHSSSGEDMRSAVDLTGRAYARLPIAFMHRKKRVAGCGCRVEPWSVEAMARHEGYAIAEGGSMRGMVVAGGSSRGQGALTVVAGNYSVQAAEPKVEMASESVGESVGESVDETAASAATARDANASEAVVATGGRPVETLALSEPRPELQNPGSGDRVRLPAVKPKQARRSPVAAAPVGKQPNSAAAARGKPTRIASAAPAGAKLVWPGDPR